MFSSEMVSDGGDGQTQWKWVKVAICTSVIDEGLPIKRFHHPHPHPHRSLVGCMGNAVPERLGARHNA